MPVEIKPCPFCSGDANLREVRIVKHRWSGYEIHHHCQLFSNIHTYIFTDKKDCINAWNRRVEAGRGENDR